MAEPQNGLDELFGELRQESRLLKLDTPIGVDTLLPQRVHGYDHVSDGFDYTVDLLSLDQDVELKLLIAHAVTLWVLQTDASYLPLHGYVHTVKKLGSDGQLAAYQLTFASCQPLRPKSSSNATAFSSPPTQKSSLRPLCTFAGKPPSAAASISTADAQPRAPTPSSIHIYMMSSRCATAILAAGGATAMMVRTRHWIIRSAGTPITAGWAGMGRAAPMLAQAGRHLGGATARRERISH